jgi:hypothetical protein
VTVPWSIPVGTARMPSCLSPRNHLLGRPGGGQIGIGDRQSHQRIAHRTADHADLFTVLIETAQRSGQALLQPVLTGNA